jgi:hypothetical protein
MTTTIPNLAAEAEALKVALDVLGPGAHVASTHDIGVWAIEYALHGWEVFPLRGKVPAIRGGRGFLDATTDIDQIAAWWSGPYAGANIGIRPPEAVVVLDVDEHGEVSGTATMKALTDRYGRLPETMTVKTGGGGWHLYFRHPGGKISADRMPGVDLKDHNGYVAAPPSRHPSGNLYQRVGRQDVIADMPGWLVKVQRPARPTAAATTAPARTGRGAPDLSAWSPSTSIADKFTNGTTWAQILEPHGWRLVGGGDGDSDGSRWRHPTATSAWSATVRHGCLFNYSPNSGLPIVGDGGTNGLTRFRAHAHLDHGGDLSAAATALKGAAA